MGWCMATYHRCIRFDRDDKQNISTFGTLAQFLWHLNFTGEFKNIKKYFVTTPKINRTHMVTILL